jgi:hypothetical protein
VSRMKIMHEDMHVACYAGIEVATFHAFIRHCRLSEKSGLQIDNRSRHMKELEFVRSSSKDLMQNLEMVEDHKGV